MKSIAVAIDFVQNEMQDPRRILFKRTKAEVFCFVIFLFLTAEVSLYYLMYN